MDELTKTAVLREDWLRARRQQERLEDRIDVFLRWTFVLLVILLAGSLVDTTRPVVLIIPFVLLYAAARVSYLVSYILFARLQAQALEQVLNRELGEDVAVTHCLESTYTCPVGRPRLVGLVFDDLANPLSGMTWHYALVGTVIFVYSLVRGAPVASNFIQGGSVVWVFYYLFLMTWFLANAGYIVWVHVLQRNEQALIAQLRTLYGVPVTLDQKPD